MSGNAAAYAVVLMAVKSLAAGHEYVWQTLTGQSEKDLMPIALVGQRYCAGTESD